MKTFLVIFVALLVLSCAYQKKSIDNFKGQNLVHDQLATTWDEAMPLGNGMIGNLVWQKNGKLRFSLDRADLWDLRPMENLKFHNWKFQDVYRHWKNDTYGEVQNQFDAPYGQLPGPSKIPGGALEFDISKLGKVKSVVLDIEKAVCTVEWESGTKLTTFVHAKKPVGWYKFENLKNPISVELISPAYNRPNEEGITDQSRNALNKLGYEQGEIIAGENSLLYNQKGWGDFSYQISTQWDESENGLIGCWSVSSDSNSLDIKLLASDVVKDEIAAGFNASVKTHELWWGDYWAKSAISVPDSVLQRQYYLEMYKFGSAARADAPPISLQSVWTADHGKLPPWKGDFHHDLNTQLSYWPSYAGNYLQLEEGFINWLWKCRPAFKNYTTSYFGVNGLNVPGVSTLEGEPMGGWIQYAFGQGVAAWLGHHFYLHWKYSMDRNFLETRAYPWLKDVAVFLEQISVIDDSGKRKLRISSSPEIYNNSRKAWFSETTNFDLALIRWNFEKAAELATELELKDEAAHWTQILTEWPGLAVDEETGLEFAPGFPYNESHRHFSHQMAYHPLGLLDFSKGKEDQKIIQNTITNLEKQGPDYWTGYSYSWMGNLYARSFQGEKAANVLRIFADCFCLKNSFHANGDQCKKGYSKFTYRPFTLEGNFAFASAIQEMLIQSHTGVVKVFPSIPASWKNVSFENLRTYGAFLVTAEKKDGAIAYLKVKSENGGVFRMFNPFEGKEPKIEGIEFKLDVDTITIEMSPGQELEIMGNTFN